MNRAIAILLAGACLMLGSCVKNEAGVDAEPMEVSYQVVQAPTTVSRGDMTNKTTYPTDRPFGVYAYFLPSGDTWDAHKATAELYIPNDQVAYGAGKWRAAATYYWPKKGSLTFFAYSPSTLAGFSGFGWGKTGISLTGWSTALNPDVDVMMADVAKDKIGNQDSYAYNGVPTLFRHELACISFNAKLDEVYANRAVRIKKVELTNIYTSGDYSVDTWTNQSALQTISQYDDFTGVTLSTDPQAIGTTQRRKVIPQALNANAYFNVTYTVFTTVSGITSSETFTKNIQVKTISPAWYMNKDITFTLIVSLGTNYIEFNASVADWNEYGDAGTLVVH